MSLNQCLLGTDSSLECSMNSFSLFQYAFYHDNCAIPSSGYTSEIEACSGNLISYMCICFLKDNCNENIFCNNAFN